MNAYWDVVKPYVVDGVIRRDWPFYQMWADGMRMHYSWTVTDPATVEFVARHLGVMANDPFAGNGWWERVLIDHTHGRCQPFSTDLYPGDPDWHGVVVRPADAVDAMEMAARGLANGQWPLLLSWPPRYDDIGEKVVRAYRGPRIVHLGAQGRTSDGTGGMYRLLAAEWHQVARHTPVRWFGVQDYVTVYERN